MQELARLRGVVEDALRATALSPAAWASLRAACLPGRYPAGWRSPFAEASGEASSELDLASPFLRGFGGVLAEIGPRRLTPSVLRGPMWHATIASEQRLDGTWRDTMSGFIKAEQEHFDRLSITSRPTLGPCPEPWAGQPGVAAPMACLQGLEEVSIEVAGLRGHAWASNHKLMAESLAGTGSSDVGGVRMPRRWRVRVVAADIDMLGTVRLAEAPTWEAPLAEAEGSLLVATSRGLERLQLTWRQGGPTTLTFANGALQLRLDGSEVPPIVDLRDGSVQARLERHGGDGGEWVAAVARRDGSRKDYALGPTDWRRWPLTPAREEAPLRDIEGFGPTGRQPSGEP
jgi:hypothetical protein